MSRTKVVEQMLRAARSGDLSAVRIALDSGVDADSEDRHGNRAINIAAKAGNFEIVKLLIQRGANVNQADSIGRTPLIACAESDNVEMANLLLNSGADVNLTGDGGRTALMECANSSAFCVAKRLIELGANVNMIRDDGSTALHEAVFSACEDYQPPSENRIIPLLIESGADPSLPDHAGLTPRDLAEQYTDEINYVPLLNQTRKAK